MRISTTLENQIVRTAIIALTVFAVFRLEQIFPLVQANDYLWHDYDLDAFLLENPDGILGMIPSFTCPSALQVCSPAREIEVGRLADPMLSSGYVFTFVGLWISFWLDGKYRTLSQQLRSEDIVTWTAQDDRVIEKRRRAIACGSALIVGILISVGFFQFYGGLPSKTWEWEHSLSSIVLGALAGHRLGASAAYGTVGWRLNQSRRQLRLIIGHVDKAGGARKAGEFIAFQGVLSFIAIIWLTFWVVLETQFQVFRDFYGTWASMHMGLLFVALLLCWLAFVGPLIVFSSHYAKAKHELSKHWNALTHNQMANHLSKFEAASDWQAAKEAVDACEEISTVTNQIESMNSRPLRPSVQGIFSVTTLFPIFILVLEKLVGDTSILVVMLTKLFDLFERLLS